MPVEGRLRQMKANRYFQEFQQIIKEAPRRYYRDYLLAKDKVDNSTAIYKGEPVKFLYQALFLTREDLEELKYLSSTLIRILKKVIQEYRQNPAFRRYFGFPALMEELILVDPGYEIEFPMARFDLFYPFNKNSKFCELNADGSSAMNEVRVLQRVIKESAALAEIGEKDKFRGFELFHSWIDAIIENYKEFNQGIEDKPNIAIMDFEGEGTIYEFKEFQKRFSQRGYRTVICDPRELKYSGGRLFYGDLEIDLIYRRATTVRLIEEADKIRDFIQAYREGAVCVVGGLVSQVIHNKIIFAILHDEEKIPFLDGEEIEFIKRHIPFTRVFDYYNRDLLQEVIADKDHLLLKPFDKAASHGVYIGRDYSEEEWKELLKKAACEDYLVQEFIDIPCLEMASVDDETLHFEKFGYLIGLFLYNQQLAGLYTRAGRRNIIGSIAECFTVPNFIVE